MTCCGGAEGDDRLSGGQGNDLLDGGAGADTFVFSSGDDQDRITGFDDSSDMIEFSGFSLADVNAALSFATQILSDTVFDFGNGDTLTVLNMQIADLSDNITIV